MSVMTTACDFNRAQFVFGGVVVSCRERQIEVIFPENPTCG